MVYHVAWYTNMWYTHNIQHPPTPRIPTPHTTAAASRYTTDFQELRRLGRGGFGVVVAAINRLDGRQYAIKKIPIDQRVPAAYARILREVATLSRLSSAHVVRYYQAWCEWVGVRDALGGESDGEGDSELGAWGGSSTATGGGRDGTEEQSSGGAATVGGGGKVR